MNIEKYNEFEATLTEVETTANFLPDVSSKDGYKKSKEIALHGRKVWNAIDKTRKELGSDARKMVDQINTEGKEYLARIDSAINPHLEAYKEHDASIKREKEQFEQRVTARIESFCIPPDAHTMSSDDLGFIVEQYKDDPLEGFYDRTVEAGQKRNYVVEQLISIRASKIVQEEQAKAFEAQQVELEKQREEQAKAQAVIDEANRIQAEKLAEEQEKLHAEQRLREQAERERLAVDQAKEQAEKAAQAAIDEANRRASYAAEEERQRIEAEQQRIAQEQEVERIKAEKKAANKNHMRAINNEAKKCFIDAGFSDGDAQEIVTLIAEGTITHAQINY